MEWMLRCARVVAIYAFPVVAGVTTGVCCASRVLAQTPVVPPAPPGNPLPPLTAAERADAAALASDSAIASTDTIRFTADTTLRLGDAIALALRVNPAAAAATAGVRIARANQRVATGEFLPTLSVTSSILHNGTPSLDGLSTAGAVTGTEPNATTGPVTASDAALHSIASASRPTVLGGAPSPSLGPLQSGTGSGAPASAGAGSPNYFNGYAQAFAAWDVFTAGRRNADLRFGRALERSAESSRIEQNFFVIAAVKTAFYNVLRAEDLEAVARVEIARAQQDLQAARHRRDVGTATTADVLQFQLDLATALQALIQARINRRTNAYELGRLAGIDGAAEALREGTYDPTPLSLPDSAIVTLAVREAPALLAARDSSRAADAALVAARTQYVPTLTLGGSYTWVYTPATNGNLVPGWAVDLGTSFPIFNGFLREASVERASAASYAATYAARDAERNARSQAHALLGAVGLALEEVTIARGSVVVATENYRVVSSRYSVGVATVLDLSVAEQTLATAEQQLVNARYDYQLARADLQSLIGRDV
jgi:outer membrane protein